MNTLMDKVLDRLVPKATASADTSFYKYCGGCGYIEIFDAVGRLKRLCHVVGGTSSCGPCNTFDIGC
ncbi:hypothetical protein [Streptomyces sp. AC550_RSS872]|uniref:hypothetical protein n=1 Tax=Streptomyces sp. AC550_RSS872 TaxID=2823689 RepID=UPI001C277401|nr:hypothetical protein [Streptomyces sp. AC550_RSS872]